MVGTWSVTWFVCCRYVVTIWLVQLVGNVVGMLSACRQYVVGNVVGKCSVTWTVKFSMWWYTQQMKSNLVYTLQIYFTVLKVINGKFAFPDCL